jgi:hypothetical protein
LTTRTPKLRRRQLVIAGLCVALFGGARSARAGDAGSASGASISPELFASRFAFGSDAGAPSHFNDFSPLAINYLDCIDQIDIQFNLDLNAPPSGDEIQVWAGTGSASCTEVAARTHTASSSPDTFPGRCWPVAAPGTFSASGSTSSARLHVLDLVSNIGQSDPPTDYTQTITSNVCKPVATTAAVPLNIYFMFVTQGTGTNGVAPVAVDGVAGLYTTPAALVGPFAPTGVIAPNSGITASTLSINWVPQAESIIQGYNIYLENQGPGGLEAGTVSVDATASFQQGVQCRQALSCPTTGGSDAGADAGTSKDASVDAKAGADAKTADGSASQDATLADAGADAAAEATTTTLCDAGYGDAYFPVDAAAYPNATDAGLAAVGCEFLTATRGFGADAGRVTKLSCNSSLLIDVFTVDGGTGSAASTVSDAASTILTTITGDASAETGTSSATVDSGEIATGSSSATVSEVAGISNLPGSSLAYYVSGATTNSYSLTGLVTGSQYAVAVAAVDSYGNVGPLGYAISQTTGLPTGGIVSCSTPTPVEDFFTAYGNDGGAAGGGFCALTRIGAPAPLFGSVFGVGVIGAAFARGARGRRRRKARSPS